MRIKVLVVLTIGALAALVSCNRDPSVTNPGPGGSSSRTATSDELDPTAGGIPFADAEIFLEFNSTDDDLGVQIFLDGEDWNRVGIFNSNQKRIVDIKAQGEFKELGITELRFESAEPSPDEVLALFDEGTYYFTGRTTEGDGLTGMGTLSHQLAAPATFTPEDGATVDPNNTVIEWDAVPGASWYEIIVADEEAGFSMTVQVPASVTSIKVPPTFLMPDTEYKTEVLSILPNGNKTIAESVFDTGS